MGKVLTTADVLMCPHGGSVSIVSSDTKARADGAFIVRPGDTFTVSGCTFTLPSVGPHPCILVEWQMPSTKVSAAGDKVLTTDSMGLCKAADQSVQGTVLVQTTQTKASAL